ncbi:MAG TPA: flagellar hook-length control protein FliK [Phycisphaerae bacterium]|nr:flagellar hook-length control protein FliK [Phycisphaerae bacterium]HRY69762.1 flagellar hook-length control protein FliK [Phycisphaerae bacterium]HSA29238.1 flagellar hook-length control protein FliK [Phycisphaerae bacterium]
MTTVAAADAEPGAVSRARQTVADPTPTEESSSGGSQAFAAVLTATRQTTLMLRRLLDQRVDQISSTYQRQQKAAEAVTPGPARETASPAEEGRSSRVAAGGDREVCESGRTRIDQRKSPSDDDTSASFDAPDEPTVLSQSEDSRVAAPEAPESAAAVVSERQGAESTAVSPGGASREQPLAGTDRLTAQQPSGSPRGVAYADASPAMSGPAPQAAGHDPLVQTGTPGQPTTTSTTVQHSAAVTAEGLIPTPVVSTSQAGGGNGTTPELGQSGAAAKGGQATARSGPAPAEFQSLLQQAGRGRSAVAAGLGGSAKNAATTEEAALDPSRAESIEKLARVLRSQLGTRNSSMSLRLDPPELGSVRIEVRMQDQTLTVKFQVDTQAGHNVLQSRLDALRQTLEQQGVRVDQVTVEYRPQQSDSSQQSRDGSNPSSYDGSANGHGSGFGQAREQGRDTQESYAAASYARSSADTAMKDVFGSQEMLPTGTGSVSASGVDLIA